MVTDKNGNELKLGDQVFIRGTIVEEVMDLEDEGRGVLRVKWVGGAPQLSHVESKVVEKAPTSDPTGFVED